MAEESFVYTTCPGWGDHEYCVIKTVVKDGKIICTQKADYTGPEANEGYICQKGLISHRQPYSPERLTHPLKRVGERGEGKWEEISWDQALDEIAEKLLQIREEYGPEAVAIWTLPASLPPSGGQNMILSTRFMGLWGATNPIIGYGVDNGPAYATFYMYNNPMAFMTIDPSKFDGSKYIIVWGANPVENQERIAKHIIEARHNGCRVVDIGLLFDGTAGMADWFIPVKAGTDTALALAMIKIIIDNAWYDEEFLCAHTTFPFLLQKESGTFMRASGPDADAAVATATELMIKLMTENPGVPAPQPGYPRYIWDKDTNAAVVTTPSVKEIAGNPALTGECEVDGVACETVFTSFIKHLETYDVQSVSKLTGVPVSDIEQLAYEYSHTKPSFILGALGLRYGNQGEAYRAIHLLAALTGQLGGEHSGATSNLQPSGYPVVFNDGPVMMPLGLDGYKTNFMRQADFYDAVDEGKIKAFIKGAGNPVHNCPNRGRWVDEVFPKMDLIVEFDIWMTDTGECADYVLPDCMTFERDELVSPGAFNHVVLQEAAIEPPPGCRKATDLWTGLAKRVGLGEYFDKTDEEWLQFRLQSDYPLISYAQPSITWERMKAEKIVRTVAPVSPLWDPLNGLAIPTPSGRIEVYFEQQQDLGRGHCVYVPPIEVDPEKLGDPNEKFPYQFFSGRQRFFMQSLFTDDPLMVQMSGEEPSIRLNPLDALQEGIEDGDKIECYNDRGHVVAIARLDEAIPPGTVHSWFGWRQKHFDEGTYAELLLPCGGREGIDAVAERWWQDSEAAMDVRIMPFYFMLVGTWDTLWDCTCAVRKVDADAKGGNK